MGVGISRGQVFVGKSRYVAHVYICICIYAYTLTH